MPWLNVLYVMFQKKHKAITMDIDEESSGSQESVEYTDPDTLNLENYNFDTALAKIAETVDENTSDEESEE